MMSKGKLLSGEDIKNIFAQIETPEYNPSGDVMSRIKENGEKPKRRVKRVYIIAAVFMAVLVMMGAGGRILLTAYIDADGNIGLKEWRGWTLRKSANDEEDIFRREFMNDENDENILVRVARADGAWEGGSSKNPQKIIRDYDELQKYIDGEIFKLPQYIPDGYIMEEARITFFFDADFDLDSAELIVQEEKFGYIYEKYYIPENLNNIEYITIIYRHAEQEGTFYAGGYDYSYFIFYSIWLENPESINKDMISGWAHSEFTKLDLAQFTRSFLSSTYHESYLPVTQYSINAANSIPVKYGRSLYHKEMNGKKLIDEFGTVWYSIGRNAYDDTDSFKFEIIRDEIIKIAESIK